MKKIVTILAACLIIANAAACSDNKENASGRTDKEVSGKNAISIVDGSDPVVFKRSELPQPDEIGRIKNIFYNENSGRVFVIGDRGAAVTDSSFGAYSTMSIDTSDSVFSVSENMIFAVSNIADSDKENIEHSHKIAVYDLKGNELSSADIVIEENDAITDVVYIDESRVLISIGGKCAVVNTDGNILGELKSDGSVSGITRLSDGRFICSIFDKKTSSIRSIDAETMQFGEYKAELSENLSGIMTTGFGEYLAYINHITAVYGFKSDQTAQKIIDLTESGLIGISCVTPISDNNAVAVENGKLILLSRQSESESSEKRELILAVAGTYNSIEGIISDFNSQDNNYRIKVVDYSKNYEYSIAGLDSAVKDLEMDIISGNIPDMVWIEPNEAKKLASKGAFADLYQFMDADVIYSKDAFLPNYLQACESNSHLYTIAPSFMIQTIAAKSVHENKSNWSIDDFLQAYNSMPDNMELFDQGNNEDAVLSFLTNSGINFVDYDNFTCSFDSDEYIRLLEFAAKFPSVDECDFEQNSCRDNTALLSSIDISTFRDFNVRKQEIFGDDITFVGIPTNNGKGSTILLPNQYAILENSPNKSGSWEFIRTTFDNTFNGIPITKTAYEKEKHEALEKPYFIIEDGSKYFYDEKIYDWNTDTEITIDPMTESDAEYYSDFIASITTASVFNNDTAISNIISEESSAYFAGECTSKQCAELIQNRVSVYLSEQS